MLNGFFGTIWGRFVISIGVAVVAVVINLTIAFVASNPSLFTPTTVLFVNAVLFGVKNFLDKKVSNSLTS